MNAIRQDLRAFLDSHPRLQGFWKRARRRVRSVSRWVGRKLRPGLYPTKGTWVNEGQLRPHVRRALEHLLEQLGPRGIGDYLEFGVGQGTSLRIVYDELQRAGLDHVRLVGFDSFEGVPPDEEGRWRTGSFRTEYDDVVRSLDEAGINWDRVTLIKGMYTDTLTETLTEELDLRKVSLVMVDCDLYASAKQALAFCGPLIRDEAVVLFDDWNPLARSNRGEKRAFDEFLRENPALQEIPIGVYDFYPGDRHGKVFRVKRGQGRGASVIAPPR